MYKLLSLSLLLATLTSCQTNVKQSKKAPILVAVADAYGFQNFDKINKLTYTFKVEMGKANVSRSWEWWPKTDKVKLTKGTEEFSLNLKSIKTKEDSTTHSQFINDKYWLLFPFQLVWDDGFEHELNEGVKSPIGGEECKQLIIKYNAEDGYTPGDTYTLYLDKNNFIAAWEFTKSGSKEPNLVTDWSAPKSFPPVKLSLSHSTSDEGFKLWFEDVVVE